MNILTIDKKEFQKGITFDDEDESGGISPNSYGLNYFLSKGFTLIPQPSLTTISNDLSNYIVNGCIDPSFLGDDCFLIGADGKFYILDGTTLTLKQTDSGRTYTYGTTKILTFKGEIFCTSNNDIAKLPSDMTSIIANWWTVTRGHSALDANYRHPMEVVEDTLFIGDKYKIHTWNGTGSVEAAMSLPTSFNITELIKSSDGRHLIAFASETANYSHSKKSKAKIFIIDTVTLEFIREVPVADQTEATVNIGGTTFVIYGKSFGYFTGAGYKLIRRLETADTIYGPRVTKIDNSILIVEDNKVLVFGDVNGKGNIFFYIAKSEYPYNNIKHILAIGNSGIDDNKLLLNYMDSSSHWKLKILDLNDRGSYGIGVLTKKYRKGKVWIRRVEVETETLASGDSLGISIVNADETYNSIGTFGYALNGAVQTGRIDCNQLVDFIQLRLVWSNFAIKKIDIYYEDAN